MDKELGVPSWGREVNPLLKFKAYALVVSLPTFADRFANTGWGP
jgi:hypothetical protein